MGCHRETRSGHPFIRRLWRMPCGGCRVVLPMRQGLSRNTTSATNRIARRSLSRLQGVLARSNTVAALAALAGRQLDGVVYLHLGHNIDHSTNGEALLMERMAP